MDETEALTICFANLKGSKHKDLLATARALNYLKKLPQYGSDKRVGQAVGVSGEIVREFLTLLRLPQELFPLFERNELRLEQGRKLWQLFRKRPDIVDEVAHVCTRLSAHDSRGLVEYILKHPELSVDEAEQAIIESKTVVEREFHVIALLSESDYGLLLEKARVQGISADQLVTRIILHWLRSNDADS